MQSLFLTLSMSLDGYVAGPGDDVEPLHAWLAASEGPNPNRDAAFEAVDRAGAIVVGRRTFELSGRWGGRPPFPVPCFVVTHEAPDDAPEFTFVDGVDAAVARAKEASGDRDVSIGGGDVVSQAIAAGLLDEIQLFVIPVLLGDGKRLFEHIGGRVDLERTRVIEGPDGVTHLRYRVRR